MSSGRLDIESLHPENTCTFILGALRAGEGRPIEFWKFLDNLKADFRGIARCRN